MLRKNVLTKAWIVQLKTGGGVVKKLVKAESRQAAINLLSGWIEDNGAEILAMWEAFI